MYSNPKETNKIKICCVASADISIKFLLLSQLKFLVNNDYDVYVVCPNGKWIFDIEKENIKVKTINIKRKISPFYDLITVFKLWNYFRKEKFDIVHTNNPKPSLLGQLAAKMAGVPIIVNTVHGFYFQKNSSYLKRTFFIYIEKLAAKCSDLIFFVNREDMKTAVEEKICSDEMIRYLGGGVSVDRFNPERFSPQFINEKKKELNIPKDFKVIGIVARLVEEKGYLDLFEAFKSILEDLPKTILLAIGQEEPEKKDAIDLEVVKNYGIEKNVIFLGERTDTEELYSLMNVFVLPSYREGLGVSILEASAMEKPVVATNIRGCREAIDDGKTGILVPVKNPKELAKALVYFLENPMEAKKNGKNGRIKVVKEFDEKLVFDRVKEQYQRLIDEKLNKINSKKIFQLAVKRLFDFVCALAGLILLSPIFLIVVIIVKLDSKGPAFFKQERIGKDGKPFYPFKFRTMVEGAVNKGLGYTVSEKDERITKAGGFLRKWGIDELPQLINVLKGEMSLVGPRPTLRYQTEKYNDFEKRRLLVKPGLAGWAIVHGRNSLTWEERIKYDVWYVDNWSIWLDFKIIFKTIYIIFIKQEGVYGKNGVNDPFIK